MGKVCMLMNFCMCRVCLSIKAVAEIIFVLEVFITLHYAFFTTNGCSMGKSAEVVEEMIERVITMPTLLFRKNKRVNKLYFFCRRFRSFTTKRGCSQTSV